MKKFVLVIVGLLLVTSAFCMDEMSIQRKKSGVILQERVGHVTSTFYIVEDRFCYKLCCSIASELSKSYTLLVWEFPSEYSDIPLSFIIEKYPQTPSFQETGNHLISINNNIKEYEIDSKENFDKFLQTIAEPVKYMPDVESYSEIKQDDATVYIFNMRWK